MNLFLRRCHRSESLDWRIWVEVSWGGRERSTRLRIFFFSLPPPLSQSLRPSLPPCSQREEGYRVRRGGVFDSCLPTLPQAVRGGGGFREERKANLGRGDNERHQHLEIPEWRCRARIISRVPSSPFFLSFLQARRGGEESGASHASDKRSLE